MKVEQQHLDAAKQAAPALSIVKLYDALEAALALVPVVEVDEALACKAVDALEARAVLPCVLQAADMLAALRATLPGLFAVGNDVRPLLDATSALTTERDTARARAEAAESRIAGLEETLDDWRDAVTERDTARAELAALRAGVERAMERWWAHGDNGALRGELRSLLAVSLNPEAPRAQAPAAVEPDYEAACEAYSDAMIAAGFCNPATAFRPDEWNAHTVAIGKAVDAAAAKRAAQGQGVARVTTRDAVALAIWLRGAHDNEGEAHWRQIMSSADKELWLCYADAAAAALGVTLINSNAAINEPQAAPVSVPDQLDPDRNKGRVCIRCGPDASEPGARYSHECPKAPVSVPVSAPDFDPFAPLSSLPEHIQRDIATERGLAPASAPAADAATTGERPKVGEVVPWMVARSDMDAHPRARYEHNTDFVYRVTDGVLEYVDEAQQGACWHKASDARKGAGRGPAKRREDADATPDAPPASDGLAERVARLEAAVRVLCERGWSEVDRMNGALAKLAAGGGQ